MVQLLLDETGTITLPQDIVDHLGVVPGDELEVVSVSDGRIILSPVRATPDSTERD